MFREFNTLEHIFCVEFLIILLRKTLKSSILTIKITMITVMVAMITMMITTITMMITMISIMITMITVMITMSTTGCFKKKSTLLGDFVTHYI